MLTTAFDLLFRSPFVRRMRSACRELGYEPNDLDDDGAWLSLTDGREGYTVIVTHTGGTVGVYGHSNAKFLPGRFPPALRRVLTERSDELQHVWGQVMERPRECYAAAITSFSADRLDMLRISLSRMRRINSLLSNTP